MSHNNTGSNNTNTTSTSTSKPYNVSIDSLLTSLSDAAATASPIRPSQFHSFQQFNYAVSSYNSSNTNNQPQQQNTTIETLDDLDNDSTTTDDQSINDGTQQSINNNNIAQSNNKSRVKRSAVAHNPRHPTTGVAKHITYDTQGNAVTTTKVYLICRHDCGCKRRGSDIHLLAAPRACSSRGARHDHETNHNLHPFCHSSHGCWYLVSTNRTGTPHHKKLQQPPSPQPQVVSAVLPPHTSLNDDAQSTMSDTYSVASSPYSHPQSHNNNTNEHYTNKPNKRPRSNHTQLNQQRGNTTLIVTQSPGQRIMSPFSPADLPLPPGINDNRAESASHQLNQLYRSPQSVPVNSNNNQQQYSKQSNLNELVLPPPGGSISRSSSAPSLALLAGASNQLSPAKRSKVTHSDSNDSLSLLSTLSMDQSQSSTAPPQINITQATTSSSLPRYPASSHHISNISPLVKSELPPLHSRPHITTHNRTPVMQPLSLSVATPDKIPAIQRISSDESNFSDISNTTQHSKLSVTIPVKSDNEPRNTNPSNLLSLASAIDMM